MVGIKRVAFCAFLLLLCVALVIASCVEYTNAVYLTLPSAEAEPGEELEVRVDVNLKDRGISAGEILFTFDGGAMEVVSIEPGALLGANPLVGLNEIDNQAGTIEFALARTGSTSVPTPPGVFALVKLKVLESAETGTYELELSEVDLADEDFNDITGLKVTGAQVSIY